MGRSNTCPILFRMSIRAVIWDMDGVIVDSGPLHFKAWQELAGERGIEFTEVEFKNLFGMRNPDILNKLFGKLSPEELKYLSSKKEDNFRSLVRLGVKAMPGVIPLLQKLKATGIKQAIASSTPLQNINLILTVLKISEMFDTIVSDEDVTYGKPAPEAFLLAANRLGVSPEGCLVIEDAIAGVKAAKNAGMKLIAVTNTVSGSELELADLVVDSLEEVDLDLITELGASK